MESDWQRTTVGAVSLVVTKGTTPTTLGHAFQEAGINFVKVESISPDGRFQTDKFVRISKEAHEALARSQLAPNDVLFTIAGTIGRTAIVTTDIESPRESRRLVGLSCQLCEVACSVS
jgi:type I restriction enzyme, S subunit